MQKYSITDRLEYYKRRMNKAFNQIRAANEQLERDRWAPKSQARVNHARAKKEFDEAAAYISVLKRSMPKDTAGDKSEGYKSGEKKAQKAITKAFDKKF